MRRWQSHKIVEAEHIIGISGVAGDTIIVGDGSYTQEIHLDPSTMARITLSASEHADRQGLHFQDPEGPLKEGLLVKYEISHVDGYLSWSPAGVFKGGYFEILDDEPEVAAAGDAP